MLIRSLCLSALVSASLQATAPAQTPIAYSTVPTGAMPAATAQPPGSYERVSGRNNPALSFYGGSAAMAYSAPRARPLPPPRPVNLAPNAKPFTGVQQTSGVTPYLGLDAARETDNSLPNYYTYVRPQLDQQRMNQVQLAQFRRLQQQVRTASSPGVAMSAHGGIPTTGSSDQFQNHGGYYPTRQR